MEAGEYNNLLVGISPQWRKYKPRKVRRKDNTRKMKTNKNKPKSIVTPFWYGANNGIRTRNIQLGKLTLYH